MIRAILFCLLLVLCPDARAEMPAQRRANRRHAVVRSDVNILNFGCRRAAPPASPAPAPVAPAPLPFSPPPASTDPAVLNALANLQAQQAQMLSQQQAHTQAINNLAGKIGSPSAGNASPYIIVLPPGAGGPIVTPPVGGAPLITPPVGGAPLITPPVGGAPLITPPVGGAPLVSPPVGGAPLIKPPVSGPPTTPPPVSGAPLIAPPVGGAPLTVPGPLGTPTPPGTASTPPAGFLRLTQAKKTRTYALYPVK